jgi:hypothetical protein
MFETEFVEKNKTYFVFNNFCSENRTVYEITWKNMVDPDRPQMTIRRMRIARCIIKAIDTNSAYVMIIAFIGIIIPQCAPTLPLYVHSLSCLLIELHMNKSDTLFYVC